MPITKSAKKSLEQSKKKYAVNLRTTRQMKDLIKQTGQLITANDAVNAKTTLQKAIQSIDKAVKKDILKQNTASRKVSRLTKAVNKFGK